MKIVYTAEEWREGYRRGHLAFIVRYVKVFLRDYVFLALVMLVLIRFGVMETYGVSVMICEGVAFVLLGVVIGELQWFLLKRRFGVPDDL